MALVILTRQNCLLQSKLCRQNPHRPGVSIWRFMARARAQPWLNLSNLFLDINKNDTGWPEESWTEFSLFKKQKNKLENTASKEWDILGRSEMVTLAVSTPLRACLCFPLPYRNCTKSPTEIPPAFLVHKKGLQRLPTKGTLLWKKVIFFQSGLWHSLLHASKEACQQIFLCVSPRNVGFIS